MLSDEPTDRDTVADYSQRFAIEENFLDDKSNGFQLESSELGATHSLTRLMVVLAVATVTRGGHFVSQLGQQVYYLEAVIWRQS